MHIAPSAKHWLIRRLRFWERYTGTDNVYLVKNAGYTNVVQVLGIVTGAALFFVAARVLPKEVYGEYKYYLSLFGLFAVCTFTGMDTALQRSIANGLDGSLAAAFRRKLLGGLVGATGALAAAGYYLARGRTDLAAALVLLAVFAPLIYAATIYSALHVGHRRFDRFARDASAVQIVAFLGMLAAFFLLDDPVQLFLVFLATAAANVLAYLGALRSRRNAQADPDLLPYATHLSLLDVLSTVALSLDGVLIFQFLGAAPLAVYSIATAPVEQIKGFLKSFSAVASPKMSTADYPALRAGLPKKLLLYTAGVGAVAALYVASAPWLIRILFPQYVDAVFYSQVYAVSLVAAMPANVLLTLFQARGWRKETFWFNVLSYGAQIALLAVGAAFYGIWGAIGARIGGRIVMAGAGAILFLRAKDDPHPATR